MKQTVEWLPDPRGEAWVRGLWEEQTRAGLAGLDGHRSPTNRPHVTAVVAESLRGDVVERLAALVADDPAAVLGLTARVDGLLLLGRRRRTLALHVVPDAALLAAHARLWAAAGPSRPDELTEPGRWTPHLSLARHVTDEQVGPGVTALGELARRPLHLARLRVFDDERGVLWESPASRPS